MEENGQFRTIRLVRAWSITVLGVVLIFFGLIAKQSETLMLGFAVLGTEPLLRSHDT